MASSLPSPEWLPVDATSWEQTPPVVQQVVVQLLAIIQQQTERIQALKARLADMEARMQQRSHHSDRPPSSDTEHGTDPITLYVGTECNLTFRKEHLVTQRARHPRSGTFQPSTVGHR